MRLASSYVNANEGNVNWGFFNVNGDEVNNDENFWNSNDGANNTYYGLRPVASKKLWYGLLR